LPASYTFTAADAGRHAFTSAATLKTAGPKTISATDTLTTTITGSASIKVTAAAAATLRVSAPATVTAGRAFSLTVTALDPYGNRARSYRGMVHLTSRRSPGDSGGGLRVHSRR